jgi:crotonobetainyl-CoA:carnitine CoA-transferase CaiB-like acyl-CoA transferase
MPQPLDGIKIIDFTQVFSGPYATYQLASLGADVIKVEHPKSGEQGRSLLTPKPASRDTGMSAMFTAVNAGKRSMTLDLKHPDAHDVIAQLVKDADVVVQNFKAGKMDSLGFGYETIRAMNPNIVYCSISGYGQTGPRSNSPAYDPIVQAISGMVSVNGFPENGPTILGFWVADLTTGMNAAFAITAALLRRATTGLGEYVDVSMLDTAASLMSPMIGLHLNYGSTLPQTGNGTPSEGGASMLYPTQEGHIIVVAVTDYQFRALVSELGRPEMAENPEFDTRVKRNLSDTFRAELVDAFSADTATSWERRLNEVGVPAGKVQTVSELAKDPQLHYREMLQTPGTVPGIDQALQVVNLGFKLGYDGPGVKTVPPMLGAHTDEVLQSVGYDDAGIQELRSRQVI